MKEILNIDFGCVDITDKNVVCTKCKESIISHRRAKSLTNHLKTIIGFVDYHNLKCNQLETPII